MPPTKNQRTFLPQRALSVLQLHITTTFDNQQLQHLLNLPKQDNEGSISVHHQPSRSSSKLLYLGSSKPPHPGCNLLQVNSIREPFSGWLTRESKSHQFCMVQQLRPSLQACHPHVPPRPVELSYLHYFYLNLIVTTPNPGWCLPKSYKTLQQKYIH